MDRRHFITTALGVALSGAFVGKAARGQPSSPAVSIALLPGFCPKLYVARDLGLIDQAGITPKYLKFLAGPPMLSALRNGDIDIAFMSANPLITGISQGLDLQCFFIDSDELHAEGLVVRPGSGITSLPEIRGKKIGTTRGTAGYYGLKKAMATVGLTDKDVQLLDMNLPTFIPAFTSGDIDGLFVWSPWLHKLEQMGGKIIATMASVGIPPPQNLYVGRGDWLARNPDSARRFVAAMQAATDAIQKDPNIGLKSVINALEIPRDLAEKVFANETLITLQQMSDPSYPASLVVPNGGMHNGLKEQAAFLTNEGFLKQMPDLSRAVQPAPLQAYLKTR